NIFGRATVRTCAISPALVFVGRRRPPFPAQQARGRETARRERGIWRTQAMVARDLALWLLRLPACDERLGDFGHMSALETGGVELVGAWLARAVGSGNGRCAIWRAAGDFVEPQHA